MKSRRNRSETKPVRALPRSTDPIWGYGQDMVRLLSEYMDS